MNAGAGSDMFQKLYKQVIKALKDYVGVPPSSIFEEPYYQLETWLQIILMLLKERSFLLASKE